MALADILNAITTKGEQEVEEVKSLGEQKLEKIEKEWDEKITLKKEELLKNAEEKIEQKIQQSSFLLKRKVNQKVAETKQSILDEVYGDAASKLEALSDSDYKTLLEALLDKLPNEELTLHTSKEKAELLKQAVKSSKKDFKIEDDFIKTTGGFIAKSTTIEVDNTFETLIEQAKKETLVEVSNQLFA